jgi:hypothetical protein
VLCSVVAVLCGAVDQKVKIVASAKIPRAADAAKHKPGGGDVEICHQQRNTRTHLTLLYHARVASSHSNRCACLLCRWLCPVDQKVKIVASPKIPTAASASKHKAGGGNVEICQSNLALYINPASASALYSLRSALD